MVLLLYLWFNDRDIRCNSIWSTFVILFINHLLWVQDTSLGEARIQMRLNLLRAGCESPKGEQRLLKRFRSEVCPPIYDVAVSGLRSCWERCSCGCYCDVFVVLMVFLVITLEIGDISIIIFWLFAKWTCRSCYVQNIPFMFECGRCLILKCFGDCFGPCSDENFLFWRDFFLIANFELWFW